MKYFDLDEDGQILHGEHGQYVSVHMDWDPPEVILDGSFEIEALKELIQYMEQKLK